MSPTPNDAGDGRVLADMTVVIPTIGRELLRGSLASIAAGNAWPGRLIVVDQSSSPAVGSWVDELCRAGLAAEHVPMAGTGIAAAMNHGFACVGTPHVAITHDDCRVATDWLEHLAARLRAANAPLVVTGRVLPEGGEEVPSVITSEVPAVYRKPLRNRDVLFPANMGLTKSVVDVVGPMDEDPLLRRASEDNEWAYRILRAGIPIRYEPRAVVCHAAWRTERQRTEVEWVYARSSGAFYGKYLRRGDPHFAARALWHLGHAARHWARGTTARNPVLARRGRAGTLGLLQGLAAGLLRGRPVITGANAPVSPGPGASPPERR